MYCSTRNFICLTINDFIKNKEALFVQNSKFWVVFLKGQLTQELLLIPLIQFCFKSNMLV